MYNELYGAWRQEKASQELQPLPKDFYVKLSDYLKKIREESRMLDGKTTKARLLMREGENVREMVRELVALRHTKTVEAVSAGEGVHLDGLTR